MPALGDRVPLEFFVRHQRKQSDCASVVVWITGLSGAGKSTLARALASVLKPRLPNLVVLDGDVIRKVFGPSLGHTVEDRIVQIKRLQSMAKMLEDQNIVTIVAVLYSVPELLAWNRANFACYREVYIEAPIEFVRTRDDKGLYAAAAEGRMKNVVGIDIPWIPPPSPDLVIDATRNTPPNELAFRIADLDPALKNAATGV